MQNEYFLSDGSRSRTRAVTLSKGKDIHGSTIPAGTWTKKTLADEIMAILDIGEAKESRGSTVQRETIGAIYQSLTGETDQPTKYRSAEGALAALGLSYDPKTDTSESQGRSGGGTVTNRCYSRILAALNNTPRCFILNASDKGQGLTWETDHRDIYRFDSTVSGRKALWDAGPYSRVLFYSTSNSRINPMTFTGCAMVTEISGTHDSEEHELTFEDIVEFSRPVPSDKVNIFGWNRQISITEIPFSLWSEICAAGGYTGFSDATTDSELVEERATAAASRGLPQPIIPGGFKLLDQTHWAPQALGEPDKPDYSVDEDNRLRPKNSLLEGRLPNQETNRLVEQRAIEVVRRAMALDGWREVADRQRDGCGYDLEFERDARTAHVEVKGIKGPYLVFNVTPKERWRIESDPLFVLIAVTRAVSSEPQLHQFHPHDFSSLRFRATGYRFDARSMATRKQQ